MLVEWSTRLIPEDNIYIYIKKIVYEKKKYATERLGDQQNACCLNSS